MYNNAIVTTLQYKKSAIAHLYNACLRICVLGVPLWLTCLACLILAVLYVTCLPSIPVVYYLSYIPSLLIAVSLINKVGVHVNVNDVFIINV